MSNSENLGIFLGKKSFLFNFTRKRGNQNTVKNLGLA